MGNSPSTAGAPGSESMFSACSASGRVISTAGVRLDSGSHGESNSTPVHMYAPHLHPYPHALHSPRQKRASPSHTLTHRCTPSHSCTLYISHTPWPPSCTHRALLRTPMCLPPLPTAELLDHHQKEQDMRTRLGRGSVFKRQLQQLNHQPNTAPAATTKLTGTTATTGSSRPKERTLSSNGRLLFRSGSVDSGDDAGAADAPRRGSSPTPARQISARTRIRQTTSCTPERVRTGTTPDHLQARLTLIHSNREIRIEGVLMFNEALLVDQIKRPSRSYREVSSTPMYSLL